APSLLARVYARRTDRRPGRRASSFPARAGAEPVLTTDDIARIPIFAALGRDELEHICRAAADITLVAGEDAAPQGSERALFGLLEGRVEVFQATEGVERKVGERSPGDIFGEVPITLGTVFPVSFRAAEPSRVLRLDPADYHAISSASPQLA